jgi:DNA-binding CsgD family transcriptional regulator
VLLSEGLSPLEERSLCAYNKRTVAEDLIERSGALAPIEDALAAADAAEGDLVFVSGLPGIGKTALLRKAGELARIRGFTVLSARGTELELNFPFGVVRQLYSRSSLDRERLQGDKAIAPLVGQVEDQGGELDISFQVLDGLYWLVADLAQEAPLLIVLDDSQWADEPSLRHLVYLCRRLDGLRLAVMLAARSGEAPRPLLEELQGVAARHVAPPPLSLDGVSEMVERELGQPPSPGFAAACLRQTGGYPLYLGELLREARERGIRPLDAAGGELERVDAEGLGQHVWRRIDGVGADAATVAGLVSVLGGRAEAGAIARLGDLPVGRVAEILDALTATGVVEAGEPLRFTHPIVRAAVGARLSSAQLDRWHRRAARLLDQEGADSREVAEHLMRCHPRGETWAAERLRESARAVIGRGAPEAAALQLRRALDEDPSEELRVSLLRELARAEDAAGEPAAALSRYDEALRIASDPEVLTEIAIAKAQTFFVRSHSFEEQALATLEGALAALDGGDPELEQRIDAELIAYALLSPRSRERGLERLARYGGQVPDGPAAQAVLTVMAYGAFLAGRPAAEVVPLAERALREGGFRRGGFGFEIWTMAVWLLILADRPDLGQTLTERELPEARREGHRAEIAALETTLAFAAWRQGDLPTAISRAQTSLAISDAGPAHAWSHGFKALALFDAGDLAAAEAALGATSPEDWSEVARGSPSLLYARALLRLEQGRLNEAGGDIEELRRRTEAAPDLRAVEDLWRPLGVTLAHRQGDAHRARSLASQLIEYSRQMGAAGLLGSNLRTAALASKAERGLELLRESVELLEGSCHRLEYARSLIELGAALRRGGERAAAREPLAEGLDIAYRCGAAGTVSRALEELRASGARPRRAVLTGPEALTPAETRVAKLAAEGRSNREIAQELYVTLKTVEGTLGRAYAKLGISGRGAREALPGALAPLRQES